MAEPTTVELKACNIRNIKVTSRSDSGAGYADIALRVSLGEAWTKALPFLNWCQEQGQPVMVDVRQLQAHLPVEQAGFPEEAPASLRAEEEPDAG